MLRFNERLTEIPHGCGFVRRKRHGDVFIVLLLYMVAFAIIAWLLNANIKEGNIPEKFYIDYTVTSSPLFYVSLLSLALPTLYILYILKRNLAIITDVEFKNALFSSIIVKNNDFCFFANKTGEIVYMSDSLLEYMPGIDKNNAFNSLLNIAELSKADQDRMLNAINRNKREYFHLVLEDREGKRNHIRLNIEPLDRPKGFYMVAGRKFVEPRNDEDDKLYPKEVQAIRQTPARRLVNAIPIGLYSTSPSGHIRIANTTLEEWLGYKEGEIVAKEMALDDLIYTPDGKKAKSIEMKEISGKVSLKRKNSSLVNVHITQYVKYDENNTPTLAVGMVKLVD